MPTSLEGICYQLILASKEGTDEPKLVKHFSEYHKFVYSSIEELFQRENIGGIDWFFTRSDKTKFLSVEISPKGLKFLVDFRDETFRMMKKAMERSNLERNQIYKTFYNEMNGEYENCYSHFDNAFISLKSFTSSDPAK